MKRRKLTKTERALGKGIVIGLSIPLVVLVEVLGGSGEQLIKAASREAEKILKTIELKKEE